MDNSNHQNVYLTEQLQSLLGFEIFKAKELIRWRGGGFPAPKDQDRGLIHIRNGACVTLPATQETIGRYCRSPKALETWHRWWSRDPCPGKLPRPADPPVPTLLSLKQDMPAVMRPWWYDAVWVLNLHFLISFRIVAISFYTCLCASLHHAHRWDTLILRTVSFWWMPWGPGPWTFSCSPSDVPPSTTWRITLLAIQFLGNRIKAITAVSSCYPSSEPIPQPPWHFIVC